MEWEKLFEGLAACAALAGAWTDVRTHRIPNRLTLSWGLAGLALHLVLGGAAGLADGGVRGLLPGVSAGLAWTLAGFAAALPSLLLWLLGALKAGDIKLYMAAGLIGGWKFCLGMEVYSVLIGGIAAAAVMASRRSGRRALKRLWLYGLTLLLTRRFVMYQGDSESYFSYGCMIAAGAMAAALRPLF